MTINAVLIPADPDAEVARISLATPADIERVVGGAFDALPTRRNTTLRFYASSATRRTRPTPPANSRAAAVLGRWLPRPHRIAGDVVVCGIDPDTGDPCDCPPGFEQTVPRAGAHKPDRFAVYVPNADAPRLLQLSVMGIDSKSAIVGALDGSVTAPRTRIYYEGNRYGAGNVVTFADRAAIASGRLADHYPTIASSVVLADALTFVGTFSCGHGVDIADARGLVSLARWLGLLENGEIDTPALSAELRLTRSV